MLLSHGVREGAIPGIRQVDGRVRVPWREECVQPRAEIVSGDGGGPIRNALPLAPAIRQQPR